MFDWERAIIGAAADLGSIVPDRALGVSIFVAFLARPVLKPSAGVSPMLSELLSKPPALSSCSWAIIGAVRLWALDKLPRSVLRLLSGEGLAGRLPTALALSAELLTSVELLELATDPVCDCSTEPDLPPAPVLLPVAGVKPLVLASERTDDWELGRRASTGLECLLAALEAVNFLPVGVDFFSPFTGDFVGG